MAKLSTAQRNALPAGKFAGPKDSKGKPTYPINDKAHAKAAIALSNKPAAKGEGASIRAKARAVLAGKGK